jgi:hypothetical protein
VVDGCLLGGPAGVRVPKQRPRVGVAGDRRVEAEGRDSLVGGGDAVLGDLDPLDELRELAGGAGGGDGQVRALLEVGAGLLVGSPRREVTVTSLLGGVQPGDLVGVVGGGQPAGMLAEGVGDRLDVGAEHDRPGRDLAWVEVAAGEHR